MLDERRTKRINKIHTGASYPVKSEVVLSKVSISNRTISSHLNRRLALRLRGYTAFKRDNVTLTSHSRQDTCSIS